MKLLVGLGNPGPEYARSRHNVGYLVADEVARMTGAGFALRKFGAEIAEASTGGERFWIVKPQTYMNHSGEAVGAAMRFWKLDVADLVVVHDDLDLPAGGVKLKLGGGHGGHNGLRDIAARLSTTDFWRLRIGIGHPRDSARSEQEVADFVLQPPRKEEQALIDDVIDRSLALLDLMLAGQMEQAMHKLHSKPKPVKDSKE